MSEPSEQELEELTKQLLEAGREEIPSAAAKARALAALGLDPGPAAGSPPAGDAPPSPPTPPAAGGLSTATKAVAAVAVLGALAFLALRSSPAPAPEPSASAPAPAPEPSASASASAPAPEPSASAPASASASAPTSAPPRLPSSAPPRTPEDDLAAELAALDRARRAIRSGNPEQGLAELDAHAKRHPAGSLRSEALVLRVEALVKAGREAEARRIAAPWLAAHPDDVASRRIRGLLPPD